MDGGLGGTNLPVGTTKGGTIYLISRQDLKSQGKKAIE